MKLEHTDRSMDITLNHVFATLSLPSLLRALFLVCCLFPSRIEAYV
jgi:ABC-type antimicrobial peptide transport system permease subunit